MTSLVIKKMQMKIPIIYYLLDKLEWKWLSVGKDVLDLELSYTAGANMVQTLCKMLGSFLKCSTYIYHLIELFHS